MPRGTLAPEAAGTIHSDFQKAFIRAEIVPYDDLVRLQSWSAARAPSPFARRERIDVIKTAT